VFLSAYAWRFHRQSSGLRQFIRRRTGVEQKSLSMPNECVSDGDWIEQIADGHLDAALGLNSGSGACAV